MVVVMVPMMPIGCCCRGYRRFPPPLAVVKCCGLATFPAHAVEAAATFGGEVAVMAVLVAVVEGLPLVACCNSLSLHLGVPREAALHPRPAIRQCLPAGILERPGDGEQQMHQRTRTWNAIAGYVVWEIMHYSDLFVEVPLVTLGTVALNLLLAFFSTVSPDLLSERPPCILAVCVT